LRRHTRIMPLLTELDHPFGCGSTTMSRPTALRTAESAL
jgi:hypothetical protein